MVCYDRKDFGWNQTNPVPVLSFVRTTILRIQIIYGKLFDATKPSWESTEAHLAVVRLLPLYLGVRICLGLSQQGVVQSL